VLDTIVEGDLVATRNLVSGTHLARSSGCRPPGGQCGWKPSL
jgi:hypothetical protein